MIRLEIVDREGYVAVGYDLAGSPERAAELARPYFDNPFTEAPLAGYRVRDAAGRVLADTVTRAGPRRRHQEDHR